MECWRYVKEVELVTVTVGVTMNIVAVFLVFSPLNKSLASLLFGSSMPLFLHFNFIQQLICVNCCMWFLFLCFA